MVSMKKLRDWWQSLPIPWRAWRIVGEVLSGDAVPDKLPDRGVILVSASGRQTWAVFDCPCRAGHRLMVNLDQARNPYWRIQSFNPLSIYPSIDDITAERRCHFMLCRGRIRWSRSSEW